MGPAADRLLWHHDCGFHYKYIIQVNKKKVPIYLAISKSNRNFTKLILQEIMKAKSDKEKLIPEKKPANIDKPCTKKKNENIDDDDDFEDDEKTVKNTKAVSSKIAGAHEADDDDDDIEIEDE